MRSSLIYLGAAHYYYIIGNELRHHTTARNSKHEKRIDYGVYKLPP